MKGGLFMLNFLVDYLDPAGADWHTSFQSNAGRQHRRLVAKEICRYIKAKGCTTQQVTCIPGEYTLNELEQLCENGLPRCLSPLRGTLEIINV